MTAADLATSGDVATLGAKLDRLTSLVEALASRLPSSWISLKEAATLLGVDPRTIVSMAERGEVVTRRCGRRIIVDAGSLRPVDPATVATLAREARAL